jgi:hypothetical protein
MGMLKNLLTKSTSKEVIKEAAGKNDPQKEAWLCEEMQQFVSEMRQKMKEEKLSYTALVEVKLKFKSTLEALEAKIKKLSEKQAGINEKIKTGEIEKEIGYKISGSILSEIKKLKEEIERSRNKYVFDTARLLPVASQLDALIPYNQGIEITASAYSNLISLAKQLNKASRLFGGDYYAPSGFSMMRETIDNFISTCSWNMRDVRKKDGAELEKCYFILLKEIVDRLSKKEENEKLYSEFKEVLS